MIAYYNTLVHFKSLIIIGNIHLLQKDFKPGGFVLCQGLWVSIPFVILPVGSLSATRPNNLVWSGGECFLFYLSSSRKVKESKAFTSQLFIYYIYYYYLIYFLLFSSYYYVKKCIGPVLSLKGRYQLFFILWSIVVVVVTYIIHYVLMPILFVFLLPFQNIYSNNHTCHNEISMFQMPRNCQNNKIQHIKARMAQLMQYICYRFNTIIPYAWASALTRHKQRRSAWIDSLTIPKPSEDPLTFANKSPDERIHKSLGIFLLKHGIF